MATTILSERSSDRAILHVDKLVELIEQLADEANPRHTARAKRTVVMAQKAGVNLASFVKANVGEMTLQDFVNTFARD